MVIQKILRVSFGIVGILVGMALANVLVTNTWILRSLEINLTPELEVILYAALIVLFGLIFFILFDFYHYIFCLFLCYLFSLHIL